MGLVGDENCLILRDSGTGVRETFKIVKRGLYKFQLIESRVGEGTSSLLVRNRTHGKVLPKVLYYWKFPQNPSPVERK